MTTPRLIAAAVCAALAMPATGCSWVAVKRAPAAPPPPTPGPLNDAPVDCTPQRDAPIADAAMAVLLFGAAVFVATCPVNTCGAKTSWATLAAAPPVAIAAALSAGYGFRQTARCRELRAQQERWWAAARDPRAGAEGFSCRAPWAGGTCDPGLRCAAEVCVREDAAEGTEGHPCLRVPGTAAVEMCRAGLRCVRGRCASLTR